MIRAMTTCEILHSIIFHSIFAITSIWWITKSLLEMKTIYDNTSKVVHHTGSGNSSGWILMGAKTPDRWQVGDRDENNNKKFTLSLIVQGKGSAKRYVPRVETGLLIVWCERTFHKIIQNQGVINFTKSDLSNHDLSMFRQVEMNARFAKSIIAGANHD